MDITLSEGELMTIFNDFHHGDYTQVLAFDLSSVSDEAKLPAQLLQWRAQIASGEADKVLAATKSRTEPSLTALRALATYTSGKKDAGIAAAEKVAAENGGSDGGANDPWVMVLAGTVLAAAGKTEEALTLLGGAATTTTSLEAVAVLVQLHLAQARVDLAAREIAAARRWAQDALLFNIADSWLGLRSGGDRYQQAYYEFEGMPVPQAVAEIQLGRLPEAEAALNKYLEEHADDRHALANLAVLQTLAGKPADAQALLKRLAAANGTHPLLADLKEKDSLFDQAAAKFSAKVSS